MCCPSPAELCAQHHRAIHQLSVSIESIYTTALDEQTCAWHARRRVRRCAAAQSGGGRQLGSGCCRWQCQAIRWYSQVETPGLSGFRRLDAQTSPVYRDE